MRKLATVRRIAAIEPIEGADKIELATVDGWKVVVAKDVGHQVGDLVIYCEIDAFLPIREEFEFLRKSSYKKMANGQEGFRLKSIKLRGKVSQGLILQLAILDNPAQYQVGDDVTEQLGIVKYEPPIPASLSGKVHGPFPSFVRKTDEERVQNVTEEYEAFRKLTWHVTEKLDGTSFTCFFHDRFGVCSRNWELQEEEENTHWRVARALKLEEKLKNHPQPIAIQGELIGESIQKNHYKLNGQHLRVFNIFDISRSEYLPKAEVEALCAQMELEMVPVIDRAFSLPETIEELLAYAEGKSLLNPKTDREGIVLVAHDPATEQRHSFKAISNRFLLKNEG